MTDEVGLAQRPPPNRTDRERLLAGAFVSLADTLADDYDAPALLGRLVSACATLFTVAAAARLLSDQHGQPPVLASSDKDSGLLEDFQLQHDEGPSTDCLRSGNVVMSADLSAEGERWPGFVAAARPIGVRSVIAIPLRLRERTIGGLSLFDTRPSPMPELDRRVAQALAEAAAIGILQQRTMQRSSILVDQLQHALNSRVVIEQAKGVVAERNGVGMDVAFELLRTFARNHNRKLGEVAAAVVRGDSDAPTL
jgi:GAF domain-containing protein